MSAALAAAATRPDPAPVSSSKKGARCPALGAPVQLPFETLAAHRCFGCSSRNPHGLHLTFHEAEGWALACTWSVAEHYQSYPGMLHGGIGATLLDEIIGQALAHKTGHLPVSIGLKIAWRRPIKVGSQVTAAARITSRHERLYRAEGFLFREDGQVAASAEGYYFTPALEEMRQMAELTDVPDLGAGWFAPSRQRG
jgi:uncharacterized protein (TIGR00369 family)